jgi:hypothetical protein
VARVQRKTKDSNALYHDALHGWATNVPSDMMDEVPKEKLLDSFLRLFEALEAAGLRGQINISREILPPLITAMRWQIIALNLQTSKILTNIIPYVLALAVMRWLLVWQADTNPGMSRLMAAIDRDLGRLDIAMQQLLHLRRI